jgi:hypothetical protein
MRHRNDNYLGAGRVIDNAVGKPMCSTTSGVRTKWRPCLGVLSDSLDGGKYFVPELMAQAQRADVRSRQTRLVTPAEPAAETLRSRAAEFSEHFFGRYRFKISRTIGSETVLGLLRPELIKFQIRLIKT